MDFSVFYLFVETPLPWPKSYLKLMPGGCPYSDLDESDLCTRGMSAVSLFSGITKSVLSLLNFASLPQWFSQELCQQLSNSLHSIVNIFLNLRTCYQFLFFLLELSFFKLFLYFTFILCSYFHFILFVTLFW